MSIIVIKNIVDDNLVSSYLAAKKVFVANCAYIVYHLEDDHKEHYKAKCYNEHAINERHVPYTAIRACLFV